MHSDSRPDLERRRFLRTAGAVGIGGLLGGNLAAAAPALALEPLVLASSCTLTPTAVEGPFYVDLDLLRRDITEGRPGVRMDLLLKVVRQSDCSPIAGAVVDVWQTSVGGRYSGIPSQGTTGQTFLRGIQITSASGIVRFRAIVPGWYPGRTAHVHFKINPDQSSELTSQLYFRPELTETVYQLPPYDVRGPSPVTNASDAFFDPQLLMPAYKLGAIGLPPSLGGSPGVVAGKTIVIA